MLIMLPFDAFAILLVAADVASYHFHVVGRSLWRHVFLLHVSIPHTELLGCSMTSDW